MQIQIGVHICDDTIIDVLEVPDDATTKEIEAIAREFAWDVSNIDYW